jgi:hypothetical protein
MKLSEHLRRVKQVWFKALLCRFAVAGVYLGAALVCLPIVEAQEPAQTTAGAPKTSGPLGTIKSISGNSLVLTSDAGADVSVAIQDSTKIVRIAPGQKDLKDAQPIQLTDLQVGDRILVRGNSGEDGKGIMATSVIAIKKGDIAGKQSREREEWQKAGVGGLVNNVDAAGMVISITVPSLREKKNVAVHISKQTILRRYAPGSVKFDDAKPAPIEQIHTGDQLRARGAKNGDGSELTAEEIVSGSFRSVSGTISALDIAQNTITVHDLVTKKPVTVKITSESQLRKLPIAIAQRIAQRLNGSAGPGDAEQTAPGAAPTTKEPVSRSSGQPRTRDSVGPGREAGTGGALDLQQVISRMPAATISDLQKGDAVMLVGTEGTGNDVGAITLLAGVEPILQSSSNGASTILSPWSLSGAPSGDTGTP